MVIAVLDELQESVGPCSNQALRAVRGRSAEFLKNHRASQCALEARGMAIVVPDELQESGRPGYE